MRSFLGVGRNAPISSLLGDMGWLPISTITKLSCIKFWLRLDKMAHYRLNFQIYRHACNLAKKGYKNWASTVGELLQCENGNPDLHPAPDCSNMLPYYQGALIMLFEEQWHENINCISTQSGSEGRLKLYRKIKTNPTVENYVSHTRSLGERRVMAGLRMGCLPLAVETGRYTNTPFGERLCRLCDGREVKDQVHFLIICPTLLHLRMIMFNHCAAADPNFYHYSPLVKTKFILRQYNDFIVKLILQMYLYRQSILFHS